MKEKLRQLIEVSGFTIPDGFDKAMESLPEGSFDLQSVNISTNPMGGKLLSIVLSIKLARYMKGEITILASR